MIQKLVSYYSDTKDAAADEADRLFIEIGNSEMACLVKGAASHQIEAFELFQIPKEMLDWPDIFFEIRALSKILDRSYQETHCYFNFTEAVLMPESKFSISAAEDFLSLIYGESNRDDIKHDPIHAGDKMVNAYRVKKSLLEWVGRQFILYHPHHTYTKIISCLLANKIPETAFVKLQVYAAHFIIAVTKNAQLQLIQSFTYQAEEDILYHVMNILHQFQMDPSTANIEISGRMYTESAVYKQFHKIFGEISVETTDEPAFIQETYPPHFFTPFHKLTV
jgi:hypothetical protein